MDYKLIKDIELLRQDRNEKVRMLATAVIELLHQLETTAAELRNERRLTDAPDIEPGEPEGEQGPMGFRAMRGFRVDLRMRKRG